ncbi:helix-turn-helix domain-containing protein [Caulobacter sp. CCH5-E12]|uniref:helix-turn-helix domain-containing protein n=1 Tax=Caulobacter sp. CCH5-E12 TaxID=1768770 RepID=UPI0009EA3520|nr:helix-turn-helix domain-containing protein [Caulobacter sp. CCH5-E12]
MTTEEVAARYRDLISAGTLENWRAQRIGPSFLKIGKAVLYPVEELDVWDRRNIVQCHDAKVVGRRRERPTAGTTHSRPR